MLPLENGPALREALSEALGVSTTIRKSRHLFLIGRTRVHLDMVEGHGDFLELEVVLEEPDGEDGGRAEAEEILKKLGLDHADRISGSYSDMESRNENRERRS